MSSLGVGKRGSSATVKACDSCRRKKRKCTWVSGADACSPCLQVKEECSTTHIRKPRTKAQKRSRIAEYESRIKHLESLLEERTAAQPPVTLKQPLPPADESSPLQDWIGNLRDQISTCPLEQGNQPVNTIPINGSDRLDIEASGVLSNTNAIPVDVAFENFAPEPTNGIGTNIDVLTDAFEGLNQSLQNDEIAQLPTLGTEVPDMIDFLSNMDFSCDGCLPPPDLAASLLSEFLVDFNQAVPLFRPHVVAQHLRTCYLGLSDGSALSWANIYVVFGIAHRLRVMSPAGTPLDNEWADLYMKKVLSLVPDLLITDPTLALIQCLLGLSILIQATNHSSPHTLFVSTALRMAQSLAYNEGNDPKNNADTDSEQQRRVFWIAFEMDADVNILNDTPMTHRREDISCSICPDRHPADASVGVTAAAGNWRVNIFALQTNLALLQSSAIEEIFSMKARTKTPQELMDSAKFMIQDLQRWRTHELFQLDAQQLSLLLYRSDIVHVVALEASYFATMFRIQAFLALGMNAQIHPFSVEGLAAIANLKDNICYEDARRLFSLLSVAPQGKLALAWMVKPPVINALTTSLKLAENNSVFDRTYLVNAPNLEFA